MFNQYTYKQKCFALIVIFIMLSITAYKRSFSTLFQVISEHNDMSSKINQASKKSKSATLLVEEIERLDKMLGKEGVSKEVVQQEIVSFATVSNSKVSISDLQPIHTFLDENYAINTNQLDLTGNANELLRLGYDFEKQFSFSKVVNMNFYTIKNNNKSDVLHLKMIFQNYENNK
jgi:hypothetical protein